MLEIALLTLFNMGRGNATISHGVWLLLAFWCGCVMNHLSALDSICFMWVVIVTTIFATKPLLVGIDGDSKAILNGVKRNLPILPALYIMDSWFGLILLLQGLIYYLCGKLNSLNSTRIAEGIIGALLGLI